MSEVIEPDGSEDITDFLLRVRELGEKRDQEDEERTRKLEEDILQGRKEREARRGMQKIVLKLNNYRRSMMTMGVAKC